MSKKENPLKNSGKIFNKDVLALLGFDFFTVILSPYGFYFFSYADIFIVLRAFYLDVNFRRINSLYRIFILLLAGFILFFFFHKEKIALISLFTSFFSESIDFFFVRKYILNLKWEYSKKLSVIKGVRLITNFIDLSVFYGLIFLFNAGLELNYNAMLDFIVCSFIYLGLFIFLRGASKKI